MSKVVYIKFTQNVYWFDKVANLPTDKTDIFVLSYYVKVKWIVFWNFERDLSVKLTFAIFKKGSQFIVPHANVVFN